MGRYSITYDFGTGSVKGAVLDAEHEPVAVASEPYPLFTPAPGFAEQKVEDYLSSFRKVTGRLLREMRLTGRDIEGVVISQTSSTLIFADADGNALCDCVTWLDSRAHEQAGRLNERVGLAGWATGKRVAAKVAWFMEKRPEVVTQAKYLVDVSGFFYLQLTGKTAFDLTAAFATGFIFPISREWNQFFLETVDIDPALLSDRILNSFDLVGYTDTAFARAVGFAPDTPVFAGCSDNANAHLGTGCIRPGDAHIYMGSSGWLALTTPIDDNAPSFTQLPSAIPGIGYEYFCTNSVGTSIDYLIREFYRDEAEKEERYTLIAGDVLSVADDPRDLLFLPYLFGEEAPVDDPHIRGTLLNLDFTVTRAHIARAVMEGIAFNYRWIKEKLQKEGRWNVNFIRAIGGAAQSDSHLQIIADVMDETIIRLAHARFAGNIGLATCVDIGLGKVKDFQVLDGYIKEEKIFNPRKQSSVRYDRLFEAFKRSYESLKDLYTSLNGQ
ncbi:MAG: hypothetical protein GYA86_07050 [Firmicutes bacterium]|nr:hypothetical protein [Bacillota bacterium]